MHFRKFYLTTLMALAAVILPVVSSAPAQATDPQTDPHQYRTKLTIIKIVEGGTDKTFEFSTSGIRSEFHTKDDLSQSTVLLRPKNGQDRATYYIRSGPDNDNIITEKLTPGVTLTSVACERLNGTKMDDGRGGPGPVPLTLDLPKGEFSFSSWYKDEIECTVTNAIDPPTLIIKKIVKAQDSQVPFEARNFAFKFNGADIETPPITVTERNQAFASPSISLGNETTFVVTEVPQDGYRIDASDDRFGCRVNDTQTTIGEPGNGFCVRGRRFYRPARRCQDHVYVRQRAGRSTHGHDR